MTKVIQTQKTTLAGSGITAADTSIILNSFKLPDGTTITNTDLSTINYATLEPGTSREEQISFTGVTQNIDGTATITGVVRGVRMVDPYDEVSGNKFPHAGGTVLVITNTAGFYNKFTTRTEAESVSGQWEFDTLPQSSATPVADEDLATKAYVDATATGTTTTDRLVVEGTAGETVAAGNLVYLKTSDARWWKCDADLTATLFGVQLGIAQGAGTAGNLIAGGVLKKGLSAVHSGLTANSLYYASNTAGAIATSAGTNSRTIGQSRTTSTLYFDPDFNSASNGLPTSFVSTSAGAADSGKGAVLNASGLLDKTLTKTPIVRTYTTSGSPHTWTKPTGLKYVIVELCGGGGGGGGAFTTSGNPATGGGGGAGGYCKKLISASTLGSTETITIGANGTGGTGTGAGTAGGNSSFGSILTANGGSGGAHESSGGAGGTATGGDINVTGGAGGGGDDETTGASGVGGSNLLGSGGASLSSDANGRPASGYGAGGGGALDRNDTGGQDGGDGTSGFCVLTEYYN